MLSSMFSPFGRHGVASRALPLHPRRRRRWWCTCHPRQVAQEFLDEDVTDLDADEAPAINKSEQVGVWR